MIYFRNISRVPTMNYAISTPLGPEEYTTRNKTVTIAANHPWDLCTRRQNGSDRYNEYGI